MRHSRRRFAHSSWAHHLKDELSGIERNIQEKISSTASEGEAQLNIAIRQLGDLGIHTETAADGDEEDVVKTIVGHGDVWAAQEALQQARFLFGAAGNLKRLALVPELKDRIDALINLSSAQARGRPQDLEYPAKHYTGQVNEYLEITEPTVLGEPPSAARWVEAKAGRLIFTVKPDLLRGLELDPHTGWVTGYPAVQGSGTFEVSVANTLGAASFRFSLDIAEDPLEAAQRTPRFEQRVERMMLASPEEAAREVTREKRERLARFSGPFPLAYQVEKPTDESTSPRVNPRPASSRRSPRSPPKASPRGPSEHEASGPAGPPPARRELSDDFVRAPGAGSGAMSRSQLQIIYRDYRLY